MSNIKLNLPNREYYTFEELSKRWGIDESLIEHYLRIDKIKFCQIQYQNTNASITEQKRVIRLKETLNSFVIDDIAAELAKETLSKKDRAFLIDIQDEFALINWLFYKSVGIKKIVVIIPIDEVIRCEKEWIKKESRYNKNFLVREIVNKAARDLFNETEKLPQYSAVLKRINEEASKDGNTGQIVKHAGKEGIILVADDNIITVKTIQHWLGDFRKDNR